MKIAILGSRGIPARYGGFETFAEELSGRLVDKSIDVTVYCQSKENGPPLFYNGAKLCYIKAFKLGPLSTILFDLKCLWHARKSYDVVYMLGYGTSLFCFIPRLFGTEVWINMDGVEWLRAKWSRWARIWLRMMETVAMWVPNRIICDAESIRNYLNSRHSILPACSIIPYGAPIVERSGENRALKELNLLPESYYLVVCRLEPENHVLEIIEGFSMSNSKRSLVIVGDAATKTPYTKRLLDRARDERVKFVGAVYDKVQLQILRINSFAYLHGHSVGGTNPSLLEAMGCGKLIIAHDNSFNREVAKEVAFFFKNKNDILSLIEKVEILREEDLNKRSTRAMEIVRLKYNWDAITGAYLSLIEQKRRSGVFFLH